MEKKKEKREAHCKSWIKDTYNVTDGMLEKYFPEPDLEVKNPHYATGPKMQLWYIETIEETLRNEDLQNAIQNNLKHREARRAGAKRGVEKKVAKTRQWVEDAIEHIEIEHVPDRTVRKWAVEDHADFLNGRERYDEAYDCRFADEDTVTRWTVNYIRHCLTNYEEVLYYLSGRVGQAQAYWIFDKAIYKKIAQVYPKYADECKRQYELKCCGCDTFDDNVKLEVSDDDGIEAK